MKDEYTKDNAFYIEEVVQNDSKERINGDTIMA